MRNFFYIALIRQLNFKQNLEILVGLNALKETKVIAFLYLGSYRPQRTVNVTFFTALHKVCLSCFSAEIWLLVWFGGHIGRHLEKYSIVRIEDATIVFLVHEYILIATKFVSLLCYSAEIWLLVWFGGHIGRHLEKYSIFRNENATIVFLVHEYILIDTKFVSLSCLRAEI